MVAETIEAHHVIVTLECEKRKFESELSIELQAVPTYIDTFRVKLRVAE